MTGKEYDFFFTERFGVARSTVIFYAHVSMFCFVIYFSDNVAGPLRVKFNINFKFNVQNKFIFDNIKLRTRARK